MQGKNQLRQKAGGRPKASLRKPETGILPTTDLLEICADFEGIDTPDYFKTEQHQGNTEFFADRIYQRTLAWINTKIDANQINLTLVEQYAGVYGRYIQIQENISKWGLLAKHPTTGAPQKSPFVDMMVATSKELRDILFQIHQAMAEVPEASDEDDPLTLAMKERLNK